MGTLKMVLTIKISYCGGWRYRRIYEPKFKQVKSQLESKFPRNKIEIIGRKVPGGVGTFEVEIEGVKLLHSKRKGQGFVDSPEKLDKIFEEIEMALLMKS